MLTKRLQGSLKKSKVKPPKEEPVDVRQYIFSKMKEEVNTWLDEKAGEITEVLKKVTIDEINESRKLANQIVQKEINKLRENELHNIKKGDPGKNAVITEQIKQEIASKIEVPVVEKIIERTEVIKEVPIVTEVVKKEITNEIKEIAKHEEPQEIATKLNTLTGAVDMSVIQGLNEMFANMQRVFNQRERGGGSPGGGGMGNPQHERFNVTTATSTITLVYKIAAQGEAIMAGRYQGQVLDKDVHYTVGNDYKTITFDSTMQAQFTDGDVVSFTYIRG